ncbi:hypothetical protein NC651_014920 [Populus alba x Populus x berolinensis]|nr:hypothetical protein NC651_014920 [Populus alba x Populus x berolinensis]
MKKNTTKEVQLSSALRYSSRLHHFHRHPHAHVVKNAVEAHVVITFVCQQYLHIVMYLVEGQSVI